MNGSYSTYFRTLGASQVKGRVSRWLSTLSPFWWLISAAIRYSIAPSCIISAMCAAWFVSPGICSSSSPINHVRMKTFCLQIKCLLFVTLYFLFKMIMKKARRMSFATTYKTLKYAIFVSFISFNLSTLNLTFLNLKIACAERFWKNLITFKTIHFVFYLFVKHITLKTLRCFIIIPTYLDSIFILSP